MTDDDQGMYENMPPYLAKIKQKYKPNPMYKIENTIRLIIIGSSISFFFVMVALELS